MKIGTVLVDVWVVQYSLSLLSGNTDNKPDKGEQKTGAQHFWYVLRKVPAEIEVA